MVNRGIVADLFRVELKAERVRRGLSQQQVADAIDRKCGVQMFGSTIAKIERGERDVRIDELAAFSDLFGVSTDALLGKPSNGSDLMWVASKLTANAQKMIGDLVGLYERLDGDTQELLLHAKKDRQQESMQDLIEVAWSAVEALMNARIRVGELATQFPLPGVSMDR